MSTPAFYLWLNDAQAGPFTSLQLLEMGKAGKIDSTSLYWTIGMSEWKPLGELISSVEKPWFARQWKKALCFLKNLPGNWYKKHQEQFHRDLQALRIPVTTLGVAILGIILCYSFNQTPPETHVVSFAPSSPSRDDFGEAYPLGLKAGRAHGYSRGGVPTEEGLNAIAGMAVTLDGKNAANKETWFNAWKAGYKVGYREVTKPAF